MTCSITVTTPASSDWRVVSSGNQVRSENPTPQISRRRERYGHAVADDVAARRERLPAAAVTAAATAGSIVIPDGSLITAIRNGCAGIVASVIGTDRGSRLCCPATTWIPATRSSTWRAITPVVAISCEPIIIGPAAAWGITPTVGLIAATPQQ